MVRVAKYVCPCYLYDVEQKMNMVIKKYTILSKTKPEFTNCAVDGVVGAWQSHVCIVVSSEYTANMVDHREQIVDKRFAVWIVFTILRHIQATVTKLNFHYTPGITPKRVTSGGAHLRG